MEQDAVNSLLTRPEPSAVTRADGSNVLEVPAPALAMLGTRRRHATDSAADHVEKASTQWLAAAENKLTEAARALRSDLQALEARADAHLKALEISSQELAAVPLSDVQHACDSAMGAVAEQLERVSAFQHFLTDLEVERKQQAEAALVKYASKAQAAAHHLPADIERTVTARAAKINSALLADMASAAETVASLKERCIHQRAAVRTRSNAIKTQWRCAKHDAAIAATVKHLGSGQFTCPEHRTSFLHELGSSMLRRHHEDRLPALAEALGVRLRTAIAPPVSREPLDPQPRPTARFSALRRAQQKAQELDTVTRNSGVGVLGSAFSAAQVALGQPMGDPAVLQQDLALSDVPMPGTDIDSIAARIAHINDVDTEAGTMAFEELQRIHAKLRDDMGHSVHALRLKLHEYGAVHGPVDLAGITARLMALVDDPDVAPTLRAGGSLGSQFTAWASTLSSEACVHPGGLDSMLHAAQNQLHAAEQLPPALLAAGRESNRPALLKTLASIRSARRPQLPALIARLVVQLARLLAVPDLPASVAEPLHEAAEAAHELACAVAAAMHAANIEVPAQLATVAAAESTAALNAGTSIAGSSQLGMLDVHVGSSDAVSVAASRHSKAQSRRSAARSLVKSVATRSGPRRSDATSKPRSMAARSSAQGGGATAATASVARTQRTAMSAMMVDATSTVINGVVALPELRKLCMGITRLVAAPDLPEQVLDVLRELIDTVQHQQRAVFTIQDTLDLHVLPVLAARERELLQFEQAVGTALQGQAAAMVEACDQVFAWLRRLAFFFNVHYDAQVRLDGQLSDAVAVAGEEARERDRQLEALSAALRTAIAQAPTQTTLEDRMHALVQHFDVLQQGYRDYSSVLQSLARAHEQRSASLASVMTAVLYQVLQLQQARSDARSTASGAPMTLLDTHQLAGAAGHLAALQAATEVAPQADAVISAAANGKPAKPGSKAGAKPAGKTRKGGKAAGDEAAAPEPTSPAFLQQVRDQLAAGQDPAEWAAQLSLLLEKLQQADASVLETQPGAPDESLLLPAVMATQRAVTAAHTEALLHELLEAATPHALRVDSSRASTPAALPAGGEADAEAKASVEPSEHARQPAGQHCLQVLDSLARGMVVPVDEVVQAAGQVLPALRTSRLELEQLQLPVLQPGIPTCAPDSAGEPVQVELPLQAVKPWTGKQASKGQEDVLAIGGTQLVLHEAQPMAGWVCSITSADWYTPPAQPAAGAAPQPAGSEPGEEEPVPQAAHGLADDGAEAPGAQLADETLRQADTAHADHLHVQASTRQLAQQAARFTPVIIDPHGLPQHPLADMPALPRIRIREEQAVSWFAKLRTELLQTWHAQLALRAHELRLLCEARCQAVRAELAVRLRAHVPRLGAVQFDVVLPRTARLEQHVQHLDKHLQACSAALAAAQEQFQASVAAAHAAADDAVDTLLAMPEALPDAEVLSALQTQLTRVKAMASQARTELAERAEAALNQHARACAGIAQQHMDWQRGAVRFAEGGQWDTEELASAMERVDAARSELADAARRAEDDTQELETRDELIAQAMAAYQEQYNRALRRLSLLLGVGKRFGAPKRMALSATRTAMQWSAEDCAAIDARLDELEALLACNPGEVPFSVPPSAAHAADEADLVVALPVGDVPSLPSQRAHMSTASVTDPDSGEVTKWCRLTTDAPLSLRIRRCVAALRTALAARGLNLEAFKPDCRPLGAAPTPLFDEPPPLHLLPRRLSEQIIARHTAAVSSVLPAYSAPGDSAAAQSSSGPPSPARGKAAAANGKAGSSKRKGAASAGGSTVEACIAQSGMVPLASDAEAQEHAERMLASLFAAAAPSPTAADSARQGGQASSRSAGGGSAPEPALSAAIASGVLQAGHVGMTIAALDGLASDDDATDVLRAVETLLQASAGGGMGAWQLAPAAWSWSYSDNALASIAAAKQSAEAQGGQHTDLADALPLEDAAAHLLQILPAHHPAAIAAAAARRARATTGKGSLGAGGAPDSPGSAAPSPRPGTGKRAADAAAGVTGSAARLEDAGTLRGTVEAALRIAAQGTRSLFEAEGVPVPAASDAAAPDAAVVRDRFGEVPPSLHAWITEQLEKGEAARDAALVQFRAQLGRTHQALLRAAEVCAKDVARRALQQAQVAESAAKADFAAKHQQLESRRFELAEQLTSRLADANKQGELLELLAAERQRAYAHIEALWQGRRACIAARASTASSFVRKLMFTLSNLAVDMDGIPILEDCAVAPAAVTPLSLAGTATLAASTVPALAVATQIAVDSSEQGLAGKTAAPVLGGASATAGNLAGGVLSCDVDARSGNRAGLKKLRKRLARADKEASLAEATAQLGESIAIGAKPAAGKPSKQSAGSPTSSARLALDAAAEADNSVLHTFALSLPGMTHDGAGVPSTAYRVARWAGLEHPATAFSVCAMPAWAILTERLLLSEQLALQAKEEPEATALRAVGSSCVGMLSAATMGALLAGESLADVLGSQAAASLSARSSAKPSARGGNKKPAARPGQRASKASARSASETPGAPAESSASQLTFSTEHALHFDSAALEHAQQHAEAQASLLQRILDVLPHVGQQVTFYSSAQRHCNKAREAEYLQFSMVHQQSIVAANRAFHALWAAQQQWHEHWSTKVRALVAYSGTIALHGAPTEALSVTRPVLTAAAARPRRSLSDAVALSVPADTTSGAMYADVEAAGIDADAAQLEPADAAAPDEGNAARQAGARAHTPHARAV